jgi:hypothetical protein
MGAYDTGFSWPQQVARGVRRVGWPPDTGTGMPPLAAGGRGMFVQPKPYAAPTAASWMSVDENANPEMRTARNLLMADAAARAGGSRLAATNASPNDPALAAYGSLAGELGGQSDASRSMAQYIAQYLQQKRQEAFQLEMLKRQMEYQKQMQSSGNTSALLGGLGGLAGKGLLALLSGGGSAVAGLPFISDSQSIYDTLGSGVY